MENQSRQTNYQLLKIYGAIAQAEQRYNRLQDSVGLLAVSKGQPIDKIEAAALLGQKKFGENYVQEALLKIESLGALKLEWHFIGSIQRNKTREIAENFSWVHSIDSKNIAERLSHQRPTHLAPLNVCLQVNLVGEPQKSGVLPAGVLALAEYVKDLPGIRLRGLMAIPPVTEIFDEQRQLFRQLSELKACVAKKNIFLDTLSMGTSHDFEAAIAEGSTIVRIGSAIFGKRKIR
jgi:PLP dependent protein